MDCRDESLRYCPTFPPASGDGGVGSDVGVLRFAAAAAGLGLWSWDVETGSYRVDARWLSTAGLGAGEFGQTYSAWESLVHPEDLPRVLESLRGVLTGKRETYECQHRLRAADGTMRWVLVRGVAREKAGERVTRLQGVQMDVTSMLETQSQLATEVARLRRTELSRHDELRTVRVWALDAASRIDAVACDQIAAGGGDGAAWRRVAEIVGEMRSTVGLGGHGEAPEAVPGSEGPERGAEGAAGGRVRLGRVLVAEDSVDQRRLLRTYLEKAECEAVFVENGLSAVERVFGEMMSGRQFDLILMDIDMPQMGGLISTRRIRELGVRSPIIALTVYDREEDRERILGAGCDDHLVKPVFRDALLAACRRWLGKGKRAA
jgi:CheY-like chemotaxis protein